MRCRKVHLPVLSDGLLVAGGSLHHQLVVLYVDAFAGLAIQNNAAILCLIYSMPTHEANIATTAKRQ